MKKILVPIDFSACASNALHYAAALAHQTQATLILVHIIPRHMVAPTQVPVVVEAPDEQQQAHLAEKLSNMAREVSASQGLTFEARSVCSFGVVINTLLKIIRYEEPNLIVMGTRGANTAFEKLIGTNTEGLIMECEFPVLAVPDHYRYHGIARIAFASNLKHSEDSFLRQLFAFANPLNSEVSVVNVKTDKHPRSDSDERMIECITGEFPHNNYCIAQLKGSNVIEGINSFLQENNVDVLAIAIHEHGFFESLFHESVSRALILHTAVPLLALHERLYTRSDAGIAERDSSSS